jgi:hypothetical protein
MYIKVMTFEPEYILSFPNSVRDSGAYSFHIKVLYTHMVFYHLRSDRMLNYR